MVGTFSEVRPGWWDELTTPGDCIPSLPTHRTALGATGCPPVAGHVVRCLRDSRHDADVVSASKPLWSLSRSTVVWRHV
jgi:hypothetical protein